MSIPSPQRAPFNDEFCDMVVEVKPKVSSFHFGMPEARLLRRVKDAGCIVICSATTVTEARDLEAKGADIIVAQGAEAGGHRGMFLTDDPFSQTGTLALVPLIVDAVKVPVLAAGGIMDGRARHRLPALSGIENLQAPPRGAEDRAAGRHDVNQRSHRPSRAQHPQPDCS
jgi:nitronate monooxygenase